MNRVGERQLEFAVERLNNRKGGGYHLEKLNYDYALIFKGLRVRNHTTKKDLFKKVEEIV